MTGLPSLAVLVPTYNRSQYVTQLLRALAADPAIASGDVPVVVADNGSEDGAPDAIRAVAADHPGLDLRLHEQGENLGAIRNTAWLVENSPAVDYLWILGDDDALAAGAIAKVRDTLAQRPVRLLHLPHTFETDEGVAARSPCPVSTEYFSSSRELSLRYHHWVTFLSASVTERGALAAAVRELPTANEWAPHIWYLNAARDGECAVLDEPLVRGGMDISWTATRVPILTRRVIEAYSDGLDRVMDERDFAAYLDDFYPDVGREPWLQVPIEELVAAHNRFPYSRELRGILFTRGRAEGRPDALAELDAAARRTGAGDAADAAVEAGEAAFAGGDLIAAREHFRTAVDLLPTCTRAWNDLGVVLHALADPAAAQTFAVALAIDPHHADARANAAALG